MTDTKELKSTFRYFLARFKPFGRFVFWGPLGITLLLALVVWQYLSHPEWRQQPLETDNPTGQNIDSLDINPTDTQTSKQTEQIPLPDASKPQVSPTIPSAPNSKFGSNSPPDFFNQFTAPQNDQTKTQEGSLKTPKTQLFQPLFPPRSPANSSVIVPANTTGNNSPDSPVNIEENNPLQKAIDREFANQSPTTTPQSFPPTNPNNQSNFNQSQNNNNYTGQGVPPQAYNRPYQVPYNSPGGQVTQPQAPSYPPAYNPYSNPSGGQGSVQSNQYPYNNTYGGQTNPVSPNQVPQNGNPYGGTVTPQIQPSLRGTNY